MWQDEDTSCREERDVSHASTYMLLSRQLSGQTKSTVDWVLWCVPTAQ